MKTLKILSLMISSLAATLLMQPVFSQVDLSSEDNQIAYSIGANIGQNLLAQQVIEGIDIDLFLAGMADAIEGNTQMEQEAMTQAIQTFMQRQADEEAAELAGNLAESEAFLAENAKNTAVTVLASGLQYEIIQSGPADGKSPTSSNSVLAHYHGTLSDGTVFDSSVDRGEPATFGVSQVISGWTEALQLMKVGDKWRLFIPPDMAYGEASPTPAIPPNSALVFEVELLEVK